MCVLCKMICIVFVKKKSKSIITLSRNLVYFTGKNTDFVLYLLTIIRNYINKFLSLHVQHCVRFFSILYWDSLNLLNKFLQKEIREGLSLISWWPLCHVNLIFKKKRDTTHRTTNAKRFGPRCFSKFNDSCIEFFSF